MAFSAGRLNLSFAIKEKPHESMLGRVGSP